MNLFKYYSFLVIEPIEQEIKKIKKRINKKINLTRDIDKKYLSILQNDLLKYYEKFYNLKEIDSK